MTDHTLMVQIGEYVRSVRLQQNKTQQQVADSAGVNRSTIVLLEKGHSVALASLICVLRVLQLLHTLDVFQLEQKISPMLLAKMEQQKRQRASKK